MKPLLFLLAAIGLLVWMLATVDVFDVRGVIAVVLAAWALGLWLRERYAA